MTPPRNGPIAPPHRTPDKADMADGAPTSADSAPGVAGNAANAADGRPAPIQRGRRELTSRGPTVPAPNRRGAASRGSGGRGRFARGTTGGDPLAGVERILVDGSNLLHALRQGATPAPPATLIGRLRALIPPSVRIEIVFDGPPEPGLRGTRIASGLTVRHSGRITADQLILRLVSDAVGSGTAPDEAAAAGTALLVVTDDNDLAYRCRRNGARTARAAWMVGRLDRTRLSSPSVGAGRPPAAAPTDAGAAGATAGAGVAADQAEADEEARARDAWHPGRGATRKTGNPHRGRPFRHHS